MSERAFKVIRLGFEPKTHSLEGCCSIQLSYRTDPCFAFDDSGTAVKSGCKDSDYFWICNKMFGSSLFYWFRKHGNSLIRAFEKRNGGER